MRQNFSVTAKSSASPPASGSSPALPAEEEFVGLAPEEDVEVPGNYNDAMNPNTKLGKAIREACDELQHLAQMENEVLQEADALLKKFGFKASLFDVPEPAPEPNGSSSSTGGSSSNEAPN